MPESAGATGLLADGRSRRLRGRGGVGHPMSRWCGYDCRGSRCGRVVLGAFGRRLAEGAFLGQLPRYAVDALAARRAGGGGQFGLGWSEAHGEPLSLNAIDVR